MSTNEPEELLAFANCIRIVGEDGVVRPREPLSVRYPEAWAAYQAFMEPVQEPLPGLAARR